jgi:hypothetical protein
MTLEALLSELPRVTRSHCKSSEISNSQRGWACCGDDNNLRANPDRQATFSLALKGVQENCYTGEHTLGLEIALSQTSQRRRRARERTRPSTGCPASSPDSLCGSKLQLTNNRDNTALSDIRDLRLADSSKSLRRPMVDTLSLPRISR